MQLKSKPHAELKYCFIWKYTLFDTLKVSAGVSNYYLWQNPPSESRRNFNEFLFFAFILIRDMSWVTSEFELFLKAQLQGTASNWSICRRAFFQNLSKSEVIICTSSFHPGYLHKLKFIALLTVARGSITQMSPSIKGKGETNDNKTRRTVGPSLSELTNWLKKLVNTNKSNLWGNKQSLFA